MRPTLPAVALLMLAACDLGGPLAPAGPAPPTHRAAPLGARRPSAPLDSLIIVLPIEPVFELPEPAGE